MTGALEQHYRISVEKDGSGEVGAEWCFTASSDLVAFDEWVDVVLHWMVSFDFVAPTGAAWHGFECGCDVCVSLSRVSAAVAVERGGCLPQGARAVSLVVEGAALSVGRCGCGELGRRQRGAEPVRSRWSLRRLWGAG